MIKTSTRLVRKSLGRLLMEKADELGIALYADTLNGRLVYRIGDNSEPLTPGETADKLGVVWR